MHVLLAEDSLVNQRVTAGLLEARGHWVDVVATGADAVAAAARQRYDLLLMDLEMPEMGGLEATAAIRAREASQGGHLPIFALTARATADDRERCFAAGMDGYLVKPVRQAELLALTEGLAAGRRAAQGEQQPRRAARRRGADRRPRARGATETPRATRAERPRRARSRFPTGGPVDWQAVLGGVGGDVGLLERVIDATLEEGPSAARGAAAARAERRRRGAAPRRAQARGYATHRPRRRADRSRRGDRDAGAAR